MTKVLEAHRDLVAAGPGGMCDECGHFALRHLKDGCDGFPGRPCRCEGMLWQGVRIPIVDSYPNYLEAVLDPRNTLMGMRPAARMNERGLRLWVKVVIVVLLIVAAFVAGRLTAQFTFTAHADTGDDGDCGIVCTQSRLGEDPGAIAQQIHDGDSRYSIWQTTQQVWSGLEDGD